MEQRRIYYSKDMNTLKNKKIIKTNSPGQTQSLGQKIARQLQIGDVVCLIGKLGAGKTCLIQGIAKGLKVKGYVNSPSFKLINHYQGRLPIYHFDLYRLNSFKEIENLGYEEFLFGDGVTLIEWAEKIIQHIPKDYLKIEIFNLDNDKRKIVITDLRQKKVVKC